MSFGAVAGLAGGLLQASSARRAADAQTQAAQNQIDFSQGIYDNQVEMFSPYVGAGNNALAAYLYDMGVGPAPTIGGTAPSITTVTTGGTPVAGAYDPNNGRGFSPSQPAVLNSLSPQTTQYQVGGQTFQTLEDAQAWANANPEGGTPYGGYTASPGYEWQLSQGQRAIDGSAASRGGLFSSATLDRQQQMGQGLAEQDRNNYLAQLMGVAGMGQSSVAQQATAAQNLGTNVSNAYGAMGNAQAAGAIGQGNALSGMLGNLGGWYGYQQGANGGGSSNASIFSTPWASSGFWG